MKRLFDRAVYLIAGLALLLDGLALADFLLHPVASDFNFNSPLYRAVTALAPIPLTLLVGFLIVKRVPGNIVGPLLIAWSGTVAYNSMRVEIGPVLFGLYYAYDMMFGWMALLMLFMHFPDGKVYPPGAGRWVYLLLGLCITTVMLNFFGTQRFIIPTHMVNFYHLPALLPYQSLILNLSLVIGMPIFVLSPISLVTRYQKASLLERQQIKWLALFIVIFILYSIPVLVIYPLLTGREVMNPGKSPGGIILLIASGLLPPVLIGISVLRYHLWDIDRIIRRTLVYSFLTLILALIYFSSVLILQTTFAFLFQLGSSDLAVVLSTLAIAALFTPLRSRIQQVIDLRFFRQKYNADQTLARFTATARSEVTLEPLAGALLTNVEETLHPEGISLWLISR